MYSYLFGGSGEIRTHGSHKVYGGV